MTPWTLVFVTMTLTTVQLSDDPLEFLLEVGNPRPSVMPCVLGEALEISVGMDSAQREYAWCVPPLPVFSPPKPGENQDMAEVAR